MGSCFSTSTTTDGVNTPPTAKVITIAGAMREYSTPVATSDVLGGDSAAPCFLCSSDSLYCNDYIPALHPEELLQPGQIYFVLPAAKLQFPLSAEDMAALAVKASSALELTSGNSGRRKMIRVVPVAVVEGSDCAGSGAGAADVNRSGDKVLAGAPPVVIQRKVMKRNRSMRTRVAHRYHMSSSKAKLSTIPEIAET